MVSVSELYGKRIISTSGHWLGEVQHVVLDLESASVSHLLLQKIDTAKNDEMLKGIFKSSIKYDRVKKISDTILVSDK
ncbi:MAG: PRC-barrel domain-containing protein [Candidatus Micrarchaeaceae archaeon]